MSAVLDIHDLTVSYNRKPVLWNIDLQIPPGLLVGIVGPNGAGKSTLIKAVMGLAEKSSGSIRVFGKELSQVRQRVSYVPQRESVDWDFPASVYDVVLMGRYGKIGLFGRVRDSDREIALNSLRQVGLEGFRDRQISQLSGGQQQRTFLARALAQNADLYFMDEPFAGVDAATEAAIVELLQQMRTQGKTVIVIHHDLNSVSRYFDWLVLLNTRIIASGPVAQVFTRENLEQAYGSRLTLLSEIGHLLNQQQFPLREK